MEENKKGSNKYKSLLDKTSIEINAPSPIKKLENLKELYRSKRISADITYSILRDLEVEFEHYSEQFYKLISDLELSCDEEL